MYGKLITEMCFHLQINLRLIHANFFRITIHFNDELKKHFKKFIKAPRQYITPSINQSQQATEKKSLEL